LAICGHLPTFGQVFFTKIGQNCEKVVFVAKKVGHLPTFENVFGHAKTQYLCGFEGCRGHLPTFIPYLFQKKIFFQRKIAKIFGHLATRLFLAFLPIFKKCHF